MIPPQGTRDFFPDSLRKRDWLFQKWRQISKSFSYEEYDGPVLEHASLWSKKSGDDILNEMFTLSKEGIQYCLRPEMTPTVTRMIASTKKSLLLPARWFSIPQCWRYESTARGRKREFYQWNIDLFEATKIKSEVEILLLIVRFLESVGLTSDDVSIKISDKRIVQSILESLEVSNISSAFNIIDKMGKKTLFELEEMFSAIDVSPDVASKIFSAISVESGTIPVESELYSVFELCKALGIEKWITLDLSIIRGLSYYTGIVFEGYFKNTELKRAILGGGRYDSLSEVYGGSPTPAIGFAMGDVVIMDVLEEKKLVPCFDSKRVDFLVYAMSDDLFSEAAKIGDSLREVNSNLVVETYIGSSKPRAVFAYADKVGANKVVIVASDEWSQNKISLKCLKTSTQTLMSVEDFMLVQKIEK